MRVVMVTDDIEIDRRILSEGETLIDHGYEVILLAGWSQDKPQYEIYNDIKIERLTAYLPQNDRISKFQEIRESLENLEIFKKLHLEARKLSDVEVNTINRIIELNPDIIHVHDLPKLRIGCFVKKVLGIPLIYDAHEFYPEQPRIKFEDNLYYHLLEGEFIHDTDATITVNEMIVTLMQDRYKFEHIFEVQNALMPPDSSFYVNGPYDLFRKKLNFPIAEDQIILLYQGYITTERNLENLVQGMKLVADLPYVLVIMGYGDDHYMQELKGLVSKLGVKNVMFAPSASNEELLYYTSSADIGLIPYPFYQDMNTHFVSPNKLHEFITAGLPIISNLLPFVEKVIGTHGIGYSFNMNDPYAFAGGLRKLHKSDDPRLEKLRKVVMEKKELFFWSNESKKLMSIYDRIVKKVTKKVKVV